MGILRDFDLGIYDCDIYVETGTGACATLSKALKTFNKCYSIDLDKDIVLAAKAQYPTATIMHGLSTTMLEKLLKTKLSANDKVLFFLDAHFPGADYRHAKYDVAAPNAVPLKEELQLIKKYRPTSKDVIICDDARIYTLANFESGNVEWLQVPGGYDFVYDIFPKAKITLDLAEHGYIIIDNR